jgi:hypothetical protein
MSRTAGASYIVWSLRYITERIGDAEVDDLESVVAIDKLACIEWTTLDSVGRHNRRR